MTERAPAATQFEFIECPLANDPATRALVRGADVILHVAEPLPADDDWRRIEYLTRGTYNLLTAAAAEQVSRLVYLSTLELMTPYDADFTVSEAWRPRPGLGAGVLSKHLGEYVCREFARDRKIRCVTLRLGKVVRQGQVSGSDPMWVDERDVIHAAGLALEAVRKSSGGGAADWWRVFHIAADSPQGRFSVAAAKRILGYQPKYAW
jgi:nucleoside-diphosphate-sugar epimerase